MHVVGLVELASTVEAEAGPLAADLGLTAFEARLKLAAGLPAVVLRAATEEPARGLAARLRARGHGVVVAAAEEVASAEDRVEVRRFVLEPDALVLPDGPGARLPFASLGAALVATHETHVEARAPTKEKRLSVGRAILTGGLVMSRTVSQGGSAAHDERQRVLYLFPRGGGPPWLLRERGTDYGGLGAALGPSSAQNFQRLVERLRAAAPSAHHDDRLVRVRGVPVRVGPGGEGSSAAGMDLLAHLLARYLDDRGR